MEKKILRELQNITKELKVIGKNTKKEYQALEYEQEDSELIYNQNDAIDFIAKDLNMSADRNGLIKEILESEEDYMRSIGIIED